MSNAKRIQKKVAKLEKRKYYTLGYFVAKIDTLALQLAVRNFRKAFQEIQNSMNRLKFKNEQL